MTSKNLASHFLGKFIGWEKSPCNEQGVAQTAGVDLDLLHIRHKQLQFILKLIMTLGQCTHTTKIHLEKIHLNSVSSFYSKLDFRTCCSYTAKILAVWLYVFHLFTSHEWTRKIWNERGYYIKSSLKFRMKIKTLCSCFKSANDLREETDRGGDSTCLQIWAVLHITWVL